MSFTGRQEMRQQRCGKSASRTLAHLASLLASLAALLALVAGGLAGCASGTSGTQGSATAAAPFTSAEQSQLETAARQAVAGETDQVQMKYEANRTLQATITISWNATYTSNDVPSEQERVKGICFVAQKALWTSGVTIADALVIVMGPVTDEYGEPAVDAHGTAELAAKTASGMAWATLDPDGAWARYDHVYLRDTYTFDA